ncbi:MAG: SOS response-associated peptidase [Lewinellaceae bacterium]|nr:SOS response-associated peptidase [Lewinellaceae bacterium]
MCGRYSFVPTKQQLEQDLADVEIPSQLKIRFNVAPTQSIYVVANDRPHQLQSMYWGLVPFWSKDGVITGRMINARAEGIQDKPSFKDPIRRRRCLVPADSFYEWRTEGGKRKVPYRIIDTRGNLLLLAGIWDEWGRGVDRIRTVSIITTPPNAEMSSLHDRMPVMLDRAAAKHWLEPLPLDAVLHFLKTPEDDILKYYRVSEKLNHAGYEGRDLHDEVPEQPSLF